MPFLALVAGSLMGVVGGPLGTIAVGIAVLLFLIIALKVDPFLSLLVCAFVVGILNGMDALATMESICNGIGGMLGKVTLIMVFGAMLGKLIEESGAAHSISMTLTEKLGLKRVQYAVLITAFLVGLPMIYNAAFLVLIPIVYAIATTNKLPLMTIGLPLSATLSVTHGYLPPHPAPTSVAQQFGADVNLTLLYGIVLAIPAAILGGPVFARCFRKLDIKPPPHIWTPREFRREDLPGFGVSMFTTLIPVIMMLIGAVATTFVLKDRAKEDALVRTFKFLSDPNFALFFAILIGSWTLGIRRGRNMQQVMKSMSAGAVGAATILFIIAGGGAFGQVIKDCKVDEYIKEVAKGMDLSPLVLAWTTAAFLRVVLGSATVAALASAGLVAPIVATCGVAPELMVLATATGSLFFSHVNDIGFWLFKEYYNLDMKRTFLIWTTMETLVAVFGLVGVLVLNMVL